MNRPECALSLLVGFVLLLAGCTTDEFDSARGPALAGAEEQEATSDGLHTEVTLSRKYHDDWRLDRDHVFTVKDESHVRAEVRFDRVRADRTYSIHLVWVKPDGEEAFRRYAEVTRHTVALPAGIVPDSTGTLPAVFTGELAAAWGQEDAATIARRLSESPEEPCFVTERIYKDAVDLHDQRQRIYLDQDPDFSVWAYLNISREKQRPLGTWSLRIYLDRRLLREVPFEVQEND